jgi:hypothetical protein
MLREFLRRLRIASAGILAGSLAPSLFAQSPSTAGVDLSGSLRARVERWDWFRSPPADSLYTYGAAVLRLKISQETTRVDWQAEGSFPLFLNLPQNAIGPEPAGALGYGGDYFAVNRTRNIGAASLRQAFVSVKSGQWRLRLGRFEFADGAERVPEDPDLATLKSDRINQRLLGTFNYALRSLDGAELTRRRGSSNVTMMAARLTEGSFQLRAVREIDAEVAYGAYTRGVRGVEREGEWRIFVLGYQDRSGTTKSDNRPTSDLERDREPIRLITPGAHWILERRLGPGKADVVLWGAAQFGRWGTQRNLAYEVTAEAGYRLDKRGRLWARGGYLQSSGDRHPDDGDHTTFFPMLSSPRAYARMPFYVLMNVTDRFWQLRATPVRKVGIRIEWHAVRLSSARDLWYDGGGAFQQQSFGYLGRPSGGHAGIGKSYDVSVDYSPSARTTFSVYGGAARGSAVAAFVFAGKPRALLFSTELVRRF